MDIKVPIIIFAVLLFTLLLRQNRYRLFIPSLLAFIIAICWTTYFRYEYIGTNIFLFNRINVYPLVLWTVGLTLLHVIRAQFNKYPFITVVGMCAYFIGLFVIEAIGYHVLNIRLNSHYDSLLGLGIIHGPLSVKLFYVLIGPVYLMILELYAIYMPKLFTIKR